jgi:ubiquinone/menaquinone biosynthesis C-methylase UbiE
LPSWRAAAATAEQLPFASCSFDAVVSSCTIKHWRDMTGGLVECARVLRPGGQLVIVEIDGGDDPGDLLRFAARARIPPGLRRLYPALARRTFVPHSPNRVALTEAMKNAGFDRVRDRRIESLPFLVACATRAEVNQSSEPRL